MFTISIISFFIQNIIYVYTIKLFFSVESFAKLVIYLFNVLIIIINTINSVSVF